VKIKLIRCRDSFSLMGSGTVQKVVIENAVLLIREVKLNSSMFMAHAEALDTTDAKYPVRRVLCKSITIPQGFYDVSHEKLFSGQLPNKIIIGMVRNDAFLKHFNYNPYNFQHFKATEISVCADGQNVQNVKPLK